MVVHRFELVNGAWNYSSPDAATTPNLKKDIIFDERLQGLNVKAAIEGKTLTVTYTDDHLTKDAEKLEMEKLTGKLAYIFLVKHSYVKWKSSKIIKFRYTFERTKTCITFTSK